MWSMLSAFQKDIEKEYRLPRHVRLPTFRDSQPGSSMARSVHNSSPFFACLHYGITLSNHFQNTLGLAHFSVREVSLTLL